MEWGADRIPARVVGALAGGATVLAGSQRLTRALLRGVGTSATGERQARVFTWRAWTSGLWSRALLNGATDRMLLNRTQEQALWRESIEDDPAVASLRSPAALARMASEAWRGVAQYRGIGRLAGSATNADTEAFLGLAGEFEERCRRDGYLSEARLEGALRQAVRSKALVVEDRSVVLHGFDRLTPAQMALLDALREVGVGVETVEAEEFSGGGLLHTAEDEGAEMRGAALWARGVLGEHAGARIGIVVTSLAGAGSVALSLGRVLREVLAPEAVSIEASWVGLPYEIACSVPLARTAAVGDALDLLAWAGGPLGLERVGGLLLSGNVDGPGELAARAAFEAFELRRAEVLRPEVTLDWVVNRMVRSGRREGLAHLIGRFRAMQGMVRRSFGPDERKAWGGWAEAVRELLGAAGWASEPAADAGEFEVRRAWESGLDELSTLDFAGRRVSFGEALGVLRGIAEQTQHAGPVRDAPVQVMTAAEAAGLSLDAVWFLGMGDLTWPVPVVGSPLVGWPLRRELGMPGSDAAADQAYARRVMERIAGAAGTVVFSYAEQVAEAGQRLSPLLGGFALTPLAALDAGLPRVPVKLEAYPAESALAHPPPGPVRGGAGVLQLQAACGFRAFAQHRLFSTDLENRGPGMNRMERGIALHRVMEFFWEAVRKQDTLRAMTTETREEQLAASVEKAIARARDEASAGWSLAYLDTQRQRLMTLGREWLGFEAARAVPFTVAHREEKAENVPIGPLHLDLRVDRIDETPLGVVLIDYKAGNVSPAEWLGERPDQPQLPLYAVLAEGEPLHAVAFGRIRPGKTMGFVGFEDGDHGTLTKPGKLEAEDLGAQVGRWREVLTGLAEDFWNGDTRVAPKEYPKTCAYCAHRLLCRLDTASVTDDDEDEAVAEEDELLEGQFFG